MFLLYPEAFRYRVTGRYQFYPGQVSKSVHRNLGFGASKKFRHPAAEAGEIRLEIILIALILLLTITLRITNKLNSVKVM